MKRTTAAVLIAGTVLGMTGCGDVSAFLDETVATTQAEEDTAAEVQPGPSKEESETIEAFPDDTEGQILEEEPEGDVYKRQQ